MGDSPREPRAPASPAVETTYAVHSVPTVRESPVGGPPTTMPSSPRTLGPRRPTPVHGEYLIVPRRRT